MSATDYTRRSFLKTLGAGAASLAYLFLPRTWASSALWWMVSHTLG